MTTMLPKKMTCSICGHEFATRVLGSTNAMGSPDLDLRPPRMQRDTMHLWVKECPLCGYAHTDIESLKGKANAKLVLSVEYITCDGNRFKSPLSKRMYRYGLVSVNEKKYDNAYSAFLWAAWSCDDDGDTEGAIICRKKALELFPKISDHKKEERQVQRADIMRRAELFEELCEEYRDFKSQNDILNKIIAFQLTHAQAKDTKAYTVADCMPQE